MCLYLEYLAGLTSFGKSAIDFQRFVRFMPRNRVLIQSISSISPYGAVLKDLDFNMTLRGETTSAAQLYDALTDSINAVYGDVVHGKGYINPKIHPMEYDLFHNHFEVVDGPW